MTQLVENLFMRVPAKLCLKGGVYLVDVLSYIAKHGYFSPSVYQKLYREVWRTLQGTIDQFENFVETSGNVEI